MDAPTTRSERQRRHRRPVEGEIWAFVRGVSVIPASRRYSVDGAQRCFRTCTSLAACLLRITPRFEVEHIAGNAGLERNGTGPATAVVAHHGRVTVVSVDGDGYPESITSRRYNAMTTDPGRSVNYGMRCARP